MILCIDPGLRGLGVAVFDEGKLVRAAYVRNPVTKGVGYRAHAKLARATADWLATELQLMPIAMKRVIIELPRIYPGSAQQKGDPNDLLDLVGVGGAFAALCHPDAVEHRYPSDWKGQVPKEVMTKRIREALDIHEHAAVRSVGEKDHNTFDAVGIGLAFLGRLHKRQVFY